ncbi:hypothetical protein [Thetidibacter halocola]|nr:hypothetical protein [Thetidibacter halocola]
MAFFDTPLRTALPVNPLRALLALLRPARPTAPRDPIAEMQVRARREAARLTADRLMHRARGPF